MCLIFIVPHKYIAQPEEVLHPGTVGVLGVLRTAPMPLALINLAATWREKFRSGEFMESQQ